MRYSGRGYLDLRGHDPAGQWGALLWKDFASRGLSRPVVVLWSGLLPAVDVSQIDVVDYGQVRGRVLVPIR